MRRQLRYLWLITVVVLALLLGMAGGVVLDRQGVLASGPAAAAGDPPDFRLLTEAWNLLQRHYVDRSALDPQKLLYGAVGGMVSALGDTGHTTFLTPDMVKQERNFTQGAFEGIGAQVEMKDGHVVIAAPMDNSPALKAGVRPGEIIMKVNGEDVSDQTLEQVVQKVAGPAGTKVTLTLADPKTDQLRDVTITRARINVPAVTWTMAPGTKIAHIRIAAFSEKVSPDLQNAIQEATKQGAQGILLDLRNNPGGLLDGAVNVTSQFLRDGTVVQEKDAQGNVRSLPVRTDIPKTDLPMVVLINQGTASAAEIVSGALQDTKRAPLVGETTFGTGTVLNQFPLSDGSAIMLAVEEWLTPKGRTIWHKGITPDVQSVLPPTVFPVTPETEKNMTADELKNSGDVQLLRGLDLLKEKINPSVLVSSLSS